MKKDIKKPLVSVVMPIYNGSKYMAEAIDSILDQTYKNIELITINDNSTDSTLEILKDYKKRYSNVKVINLSSNHGPFGAINIAMKKAKGEFIAPMDSDDVSHSRRLEKQVDYMLKKKDVIVVGTHARIIDSFGNVVGKKVFATDHEGIYKQFFTVHPLVHPSVMIRRSFLPKKDEIYKIGFGINDDYFTFFHFLKLGKFANIDEFLFDYRIHLKNNSLQNLKGKFFNTVKIRLIAVRRLGYRPSLIGLAKFIIQLSTIPFIPESKLFTLYLINKGIYKPRISLRFPKNLNLAFSKARVILHIF